MSKKPQKAPKIKLPSLFRKEYTDKKFQKKILAKLYVASDKKLVESVFHIVSDSKKGTPVHTINPASVTDKKQAAQLARIAKEIKKQKGRFNIGAIAAAVICVTALMLALTVFRNQIARMVITSGLENAFAAKCDIGELDINLLDMRFMVGNLAVANRKEPMTNLFEVGTLEMHFNLLELTRGKIIAENMEITSVAWNTTRTVSGALPPQKLKKIDTKKAKESKTNPVLARATAELEKIKSGVSLDAGIGSVVDQLDPVKFIENEKAQLKAPAIISEITTTVPALTEQWKTKNAEVKTQTAETSDAVKKISALKPASINTIAEVQSAIELVKKTASSVSASVSLAEQTLTGANADLKRVQELSRSADEALKSDTARLSNLASQVKSVNLGTGKKLVSGLFNSFVVNTLGNYYPYFQQGLTMMHSMQSGQKKEPSLKKKSGSLARLTGRNFSFGPDSLPQLVITDVKLSALDQALDIRGSASAQYITNDQDQLGKPTSFSLSFLHGKMGEDAEGTIDLRANAEKTIDASVATRGYGLSIPSSGQSGVPSVKGNLGTDGTLTVLKDGTVILDTKLTVSGASLETASFEPAFLYKTYRDTLSGIRTIDLDVKATFSSDGSVSVSVDTALDTEIARALQEQLDRQVEQVKKDIQEYAKSWADEQRKIYSAEIARFTEQANVAKKALEEAKSYEKTLASKKSELDKRAAELAGKAAAPVQKAATDTLKKLW